MKTTKSYLILFVLFFLIFLSTPFTHAQYLRSSYFMENVGYRTQLNPALRPTQGYIDIPVIGALNISASSNALGVKEVIDIVNEDDDFYGKNSFLKQLKNENRINVNLNTDVVSFGFYSGKGFWSGNIGLRSDINANIPKSKLEYLHEVYNYDGESPFNKDFIIKNEQINVNAYVEAGVGYSRIITEKLTVGAKAKLLLGLANMEVDMKNLTVLERGTYSDVTTLGNFKATMSGMNVKSTINEEGKEQIDDVDFDDFSISGYGFGLDFGVTYQLLDNLTLSASIIDLGMISWSKSSTVAASTDETRRIDYDGYYGMASNGDLFDLDLMDFVIVSPESYSTSLASTLVFGGEYCFLEEQLSVGLLSTTRFGKPATISELTFSGNYKPKKWLNLALTYSVIQSKMQTFGLACKVGPLFIATDYMLLSSVHTAKNMNAYLGISVPLGRSGANKN